MVRHPHIAKITVQTKGAIINGEWEDGAKLVYSVKGRYDPLDTNDVIRINEQGNEVVIRGEFYTKQKKIDGAVTLEVPELGIKRNIICWWDYQTHSVISV